MSAIASRHAGSCVPSAGNVHEVAPALPESGIVYMDNDRDMFEHAGQVIAPPPRGVTARAAARELARTLSGPAFF